MLFSGIIVNEWCTVMLSSCKVWLEMQYWLFYCWLYSCLVSKFSSVGETGVGRSMEGFWSGQHGQSGEALAESGTPSTSPLDWETDDDNEEGMLFDPLYTYSSQPYLHIQMDWNSQPFCYCWSCETNGLSTVQQKRCNKK